MLCTYPDLNKGLPLLPATVCNYFWPIKGGWPSCYNPFYSTPLLPVDHFLWKPFCSLSACRPFLVHLNRKSCLCFKVGRKWFIEKAETLQHTGTRVMSACNSQNISEKYFRQTVESRSGTFLFDLLGKHFQNQVALSINSCCKKKANTVCWQGSVAALFEICMKRMNGSFLPKI